MIDDWDDVETGKAVVTLNYDELELNGSIPSIETKKDSSHHLTKATKVVATNAEHSDYICPNPITAVADEQNDESDNASSMNSSLNGKIDDRNIRKNNCGDGNNLPGRGIRGRGKNTADTATTSAVNASTTNNLTNSTTAVTKKPIKNHQHYQNHTNQQHQQNQQQQQQQQQLQKPQKDLYIPPDPSNDEFEVFGQGITSGINFEEYDKIPIKVTGDNCPQPIENFENSTLATFILNNIKKSGYIRPTPIQKYAIPIVLSQRDLMGCAQTGSGKTAAFLLPIINILLQTKKSNGSDNMVVGKPHVAIIAPTRELGVQIYKEARKFAMGSYLKIGIVYGGTSTKHQNANLANGSHILVATPGRLLEFIDKELISFEHLKFIVLDEADRMLDLGFLPAIEKIMNHSSMVAREERQTLMFSATFPEDIQRLAGKFLNRYVFLAVGIIGGACSDVKQVVHEVNRYDKRKRLLDLLNESDCSGTMVFVETKRSADFLATLLSETDHPTTSIHGARMQRQREEALTDFRENSMKILIATSVAARGLDIKNVRHVINFDLPKEIEDYVHRIGRTGRVGNRGKATSFFDPEEDKNIAPDLIKILQQADQEVPEFLKLASEAGIHTNTKTVTPELSSFSSPTTNSTTSNSNNNNNNNKNNGGGNGNHSTGTRFGGRDVRAVVGGGGYRINIQNRLNIHRNGSNGGGNSTNNAAATAATAAAVDKTP